MSRSDGTGESLVAKVVKANYTVPGGSAPSYFLIEKIDYDIVGMEVTLLADGASSDIILARLNGSRKLEFHGTVEGISTLTPDGTGNILLSTNLHAAGDCYDITLYLRLVP